MKVMVMYVWIWEYNDDDNDDDDDDDVYVCEPLLLTIQSHKEGWWGTCHWGPTLSGSAAAWNLPVTWKHKCTPNLLRWFFSNFFSVLHKKY